MRKVRIKVFHIIIITWAVKLIQGHFSDNPDQDAEL